MYNANTKVHLYCLLIFFAYFFSEYSYSSTVSVENKKNQNIELTVNTEKYDRGTNESPAVIKIIPADGADQQAKQEEAYKKDHADIEHRSLYVAIISVIVSAVLAAYTYSLWQATKKLVESTENNSKRQLRAYVWGEPEQKINNTAQYNRVVIKIKNTGLTPAYNVHNWAEMEAFDNPLPTGFVFKSPPEPITGARFVVNPGSIHDLQVTPDNPINQITISDVMQNKKNIYVYGELRYYDVFDSVNSKVSKFRLVWSVKDSMWQYCDEGNIAT